MKSTACLLGIITLLPALAVSQTSVKSYTRKDGTAVSGYTRSSPDRGDTKLYNPPPPSPCVVWEGLIVCNGKVMSQYSPESVVGPVTRDSRGRIARSPAAKKSFQSQDPCPANHKSSGRCPGYVIDHVIPLVCGGLDDPINMQWQTVAEGKAKDK